MGASAVIELIGGLGLFLLGIHHLPAGLMNVIGVRGARGT
jgi:hypothetical protein